MTPTEFRTHYNNWKKTAPANDSDIIPDKSRSTERQPRHAGMCGDLKAMLAWRDMNDSKDPLQTNFLQAGFDDEILGDDGSVTLPTRQPECEMETRPTVNELLQACERVKLKTRYDKIVSHYGGFVFSYFREKRVPDLTAPENIGLIDFGHGYDSNIFFEPRADGRDKPKPIKMTPVVRLGDLYFSDAEGYAVQPRCSLRFQIDKPGRPKGLSDRFFPPPEQERFNPLERVLAMDDAIVANDNLSPEHTKALDAALSAKNFAEIGKAFGYSGKTAERQGKRLLRGACEALERIAA